MQDRSISLSFNQIAQNKAKPQSRETCWVKLSQRQMLIKKLDAVQKIKPFEELAENLLPFQSGELVGDVIEDHLLAITNRDLDAVKSTTESAGYRLLGIEFCSGDISHRIGLAPPKKIRQTLLAILLFLGLSIAGLGMLTYHTISQELIYENLVKEKRNLISNEPSLLGSLGVEGMAAKDFAILLDRISKSLALDARVSQIQFGYENNSAYILMDIEAESALSVLRSMNETDYFHSVERISSITTTHNNELERLRVKLIPSTKSMETN